MDFEWDEDKSEACFQDRGFDFAYAAQVFFDPNRTVLPDDRMTYGEARYQVFGTIAGRLFVVVCTRRGGRMRIISARKANQREVKRYGRLQN
jgi:uncharacterized DUF497 family protein